MDKQDDKRNYTDEEVARAKDYCLGKGAKKTPAKPRKKAGEPLLPPLPEALGGKTDAKPANVDHAKLKSYIERIEKLEEEKAGLGSDVRDVFSEAKSNGFDVKTMRQIVKLRKMKSNERTEQEYLLDLYKRALGMQSSFDFDGEEQN